MEEGGATGAFGKVVDTNYCIWAYFEIPLFLFGKIW